MVICGGKLGEAPQWRGPSRLLQKAETLFVHGLVGGLCGNSSCEVALVAAGTLKHCFPRLLEQRSEVNML